MAPAAALVEDHLDSTLAKFDKKDGDNFLQAA